jgi:phosphoribosylformylglycinamidine synthase
MALDYVGKEGIATSIGHSPIASLIDPVAGTRTAIAESLSNIVWAPIKNGLDGISLSANWMWACKNEGEDARLYTAVEACSDFAIELGINIPTGKDSLSMKQKYPNDEVIAPGTVIISAGGNCTDIRKVVEPVFQKDGGSIYYINLSQDEFKLGGSSLAQTLNSIGNEAPTIKDATFFKNAFNTMQELILDNQILAGHDIGSGGLITTLLEMCFSPLTPEGGTSNFAEAGMIISFDTLAEKDLVKILFAENIGIVIQAKEDTVFENKLKENQIEFFKLGKVSGNGTLDLGLLTFDIKKYRDIWFKTSFLLDQKQAKNGTAKVRYDNYATQPLKFVFPNHFTGKAPVISSAVERPKAAIIREKGSNSEREMANAMYLAGFDVKDVHMTDLISGRENLEDIQFIGAVGGFSNSDVLGSAKGWAGAFLYNLKAKTALDNFFKREDTLSVGICNGCQLFMELELVNPEHEVHGKMLHNDSHKHESIFTSVTIQENKSVMLSSLAGSTLGVWVSHGEGKFHLPMGEENYNIVGKYGYDSYPANPNGSDYNTAMMCDKTGRHLVMMPHIERSTFQWNWANYPKDRNDEVSPWHEAFVNARKWIDKI